MTRGWLAGLLILGVREVHYLIPEGGVVQKVPGTGPGGVDEGERFAGTPTTRWTMAPWARWNRIYVRSPSKPQGVVMLLVTKAGAKYPGMWAAADPTNRIVMIDVRDKKRVLTKPAGNVEWTEHPGVNARDRDVVITGAERAIARFEGRR